MCQQISQICNIIRVAICHAVSRQISPWILFVRPILTTWVRVMGSVLSIKGGNSWIYQSGVWDSATDPLVVHREDRTGWDQSVSTHHQPTKSGDSVGRRLTRNSLGLGGLHGEGGVCGNKKNTRKIIGFLTLQGCNIVWPESAIDSMWRLLINDLEIILIYSI